MYVRGNPQRKTKEEEKKICPKLTINITYQDNFADDK